MFTLFTNVQLFRTTEKLIAAMILYDFDKNHWMTYELSYMNHGHLYKGGGGRAEGPPWFWWKSLNDLWAFFTWTPATYAKGAGGGRRAPHISKARLLIRFIFFTYRSSFQTSYHKRFSLYEIRTSNITRSLAPPRSTAVVLACFWNLRISQQFVSESFENTGG